MRVGVLILPEVPWSVAAGMWRRVEDLGFDHAWTYDHLSWRTLRDGPWYASVPTLTAAAAVTETITLGTLVASPNFRHPVPFAKEIMTLDDISGGRFVAGVGAGADGADATVLGEPPWSPAERAGRFEEFVALLDRLLRTPTTTHDGKYYSARDARMIHGDVRRPRVPLALAGEGRRSMAVVARYADIWVTMAGGGEARESLGRLHDACRLEGRDPATVRPLLNAGRAGVPLHCADAFAAYARRYAEMGFTDLVLPFPRRSGVFAGDPQILDKIARRVLPRLRQENP